MIIKKLKHNIEDFLFNILIFFKFKIPTTKIEALSTDILYKVKIPTYDGSGQAVHPSVLINIIEKKYILAFTPYRNTNDKYENPSIVISSDGINFYEEQKGINPLVPAPVTDHNDDPEIFYNGLQYYLLYLETLRPEKQNLCILKSSNRINWEKTILFTQDLKINRKEFMVSPSITIKNKDYYLFYVNIYDSPYKIKYVTGSSIETLNFSDKKDIALNTCMIPWHISITKNNNDNYYMLITFVDIKQNPRIYTLYVAKSTDLINWDIAKNPILTDCYRSSGFIKDNIFYIYSSKIIHNNKWKIGLIKKDLRSLDFSNNT